MKTNRWKATVVVLFAAAGIAALAGNPFHNPKVVQALNLTPEQQQKLDDLAYRHQKEAVGLRADLQLKRLDLERELDKVSPDQAAVDRLLDEQAAMKARLGKARVHQMLDVRRVLTPEQWSKVREFRQSRRAERMSGRRGQGGFGGGASRGMYPGGPGGMGQGMGHPEGPPPGGPGGGGPNRSEEMGQGPGPGGPQADSEEDGLALFEPEEGTW